MLNDEGGIARQTGESAIREPPHQTRPSAPGDPPPAAKRGHLWSASRGEYVVMGTLGRVGVH